MPNLSELGVPRESKVSMELATGALNSLLSKLGILLGDEYKLQKGVRGEIKFLHAEMESMQAALNKVSNLPAHQIDEQVKIWARDLRELSYDIEDSVDTFMVRVDAPVHAKSHNFSSFFDRIIGLLTKVKTRYHIAHDMQDIKRRINIVSERQARYRIEDVAGQSHTTVIDNRLPHVYLDAAKLVGADGPAEKIIDLLTEGQGVKEQKLLVVSIVGVGGLGKTTIANLVYETLKGQFDCKAFVSVSLKPDMKQILSSILRQVSEGRCKNAGEKDRDELLRSIAEFLKDKRYFIVIDDLWNEKEWSVINCSLVDNNIGSRVIVTTRKTCVAKFSCTSFDGAVYELPPLSDKDSKSLFFKRIFNEEGEDHSEVEEVSRKILKKCGGVPLAIITIASMLATKPNKTKDEWYGVYYSMGSGLGKEKNLEDMRSILSLSYGDLPPRLKPCLLYLSMFPEDSYIPKDSLVRMWVAEGFLNGKQGSNLYEHGESYFNELVNRSMIEPIDMDENGSASACRVHDMILDLIISISTEENFVTTSEGSMTPNPYCKIRRLSLHDSKEETMLLPATVNLSHVRSVTASNDSIDWTPHVSKFSVLRVLVVNRIRSMNIHPKGLRSLHHLRYLELGGKLEIELVEEIGNLQLLRTLDLQESYIEELPASIVQLRQLEHLLIDREVSFPDGIGNMKSLQELSWLNASPNCLSELGNLTELRVLSIYGLGDNDNYGKTFVQSLSNLGKLRTLTLGGEEYGFTLCSLDCMSEQWNGPAHLQSIRGDGLTIAQLPRWLSTLSELSSLAIKVTVLRQDDLQLLGALPVLRFIVLVEIEETDEERLVIGIDHPFRSLAQFTFNHYARCWLVFTQGVMPKLEMLDLSFSVSEREGGGIDTGLENLISLKHVTVGVNCKDARVREVEDVETKIRDAIESHTNYPDLDLSRFDDDDLEQYPLDRPEEFSFGWSAPAPTQATHKTQRRHKTLSRRGGMVSTGSVAVVLGTVPSLSSQPPIDVPVAPEPSAATLRIRMPSDAISLRGPRRRFRAKRHRRPSLAQRAPPSQPLVLQPPTQPAMAKDENKEDGKYVETNVRGGFRMHPNHPTLHLLMQMEHKTVTDESQNDDDNGDSTEMRPNLEILELSRDFDSLMANGQTTGASEGGPPPQLLQLLDRPHPAKPKDEYQANQS